MSGDVPLTVGTAGHIDHGKTALVRALTGRDTDRLPEERARGMSIDLGFAQLDVGGRLLSLVDVPGHERIVRTVAGANSVDMFLIVVAADDGVMPQTVEHAAVLRALGVKLGVVAVTKADLGDTARAREEARALVGEGVPIVDCSVRAGSGIEQVRAAIAHVAACVPAARSHDGPAVLHVDRSFTIHGAGTVVTGTLWSGSLGAGDRVTLLPSGQRARVRSAQVHDAAVGRALAGGASRDLAGLRVDALPGTSRTGEGAGAAPWSSDVALQLGDVEIPRRAQIHHGTRETPARIADREPGRWQLRCERPLIARAGDRLRCALHFPAGDARRRRGPRPGGAAHAPAGAVRGTRARRAADAAGAAAAVGDGARLERTLREAADRPPRDTELGDGAEAALAELRTAGRAVRLDRTMHIPARRWTRWASGSRRSSGPRAPSPWRDCATSSTPHADTPKRCWRRLTPTESR